MHRKAHEDIPRLRVPGDRINECPLVLHCRFQTPIYLNPHIKSSKKFNKKFQNKTASPLLFKACPVEGLSLPIWFESAGILFDFGLCQRHSSLKIISPAAHGMKPLELVVPPKELRFWALPSPHALLVLLVIEHALFSGFISMVLGTKSIILPMPRLDYDFAQGPPGVFNEAHIIHPDYTAPGARSGKENRFSVLPGYFFAFQPPVQINNGCSGTGKSEVCSLYRRGLISPMRSDKQISHIQPIKISFIWKTTINTPRGVSRMMKAGRVQLFRDERASSGTSLRFFFVAYNQNHLRRITYE
jgi:hypothetical protein